MLNKKQLPYRLWLHPSLKHWNGYVGVPEEHPWFKKGYDEALCGHNGCYEHSPETTIEVHGGLTYSGKGFENGEGFWWFGFDTGHSFDDPRYGGTVKTEAYVRQECYKLAQQLLKVT
jgi:hypothetical protein